MSTDASFDYVIAGGGAADACWRKAEQGRATYGTAARGRSRPPPCEHTGGISQPELFRAMEGDMLGVYAWDGLSAFRAPARMQSVSAGSRSRRQLCNERHDRGSCLPGRLRRMARRRLCGLELGRRLRRTFPSRGRSRVRRQAIPRSRRPVADRAPRSTSGGRPDSLSARQRSIWGTAGPTISTIPPGRAPRRSRTRAATAVGCPSRTRTSSAPAIVPTSRSVRCARRPGADRGWRGCRRRGAHGRRSETVFCGNEIVVCGGPIGSPGILVRSGIGPEPR